MKPLREQVESEAPENIENGTTELLLLELRISTML